jgi:hypothetical protein
MVSQDVAQEMYETFSALKEGSLIRQIAILRPTRDGIVVCLPHA